MVLPLPVVAHGYLPFKRDEFRGKYEFIVAVPNLNLESIKALPGSKMQFYPVMSYQEAVVKVLTLMYGGPEIVWLYKAAFQSVRELLYR